MVLVLKNEAKYHNGCRAHFRPYIVKRVIEKRTKELTESESPVFSPKKTRSCLIQVLTVISLSVFAVKSIKMTVRNKYLQLGLITVERTCSDGQ